jgi:hypothetical protein
MEKVESELGVFAPWREILPPLTAVHYTRMHEPVTARLEWPNCFV